MLLAFGDLLDCELKEGLKKCWMNLTPDEPLVLVWLTIFVSEEFSVGKV